MFATFNSNFDAFEQENYHHRPPMHETYVEFPEPSFLRKQTLKRSYSDVAPTAARPFKKSRIEDGQLPEPEDMPLVEDDGNKPPYSYAQMIGMAILRAPNRRLTLAQIYDWISNTFVFYREDPKQGWHNSIRHNLSLNKAFRKQERPKGDAGKGSYWVIEPGLEMSFVKDKSRKGTMSQITLHSNIIKPEIHTFAHQFPEIVPMSNFTVLSNAPPPPRPQTAPALPELSSDATLPASDPALGEEETPEQDNQTEAPQSSPPGVINSSPPVLISSNHHRTISSPTVRPHRSIPKHAPNRSMGNMDDSGYFSSIESSVLKPNRTMMILPSELDLEPVRKVIRGRAEEEIVRIRGSSHDLTPRRSRPKNLSTDTLRTSSPPRSSPVIPTHPVTPSIIFKKPMRPPHSISPNTQLHMHRKAMQDFTNSPIKPFAFWHSEATTESPYKWSFQPSGVEEQFEIFSDPAISMTPYTPAFGSSPIKASGKRPMPRSAAAGLTPLGVIRSGSKLNMKTPSKAPLLKPTTRATFAGSPLKSSTTSFPVLDENDALFDFESFDNDNDQSDNDNDEGVDILKGFQRIGGPFIQVNGAKHGVLQRPGIGCRSHTTQF